MAEVIVINPTQSIIKQNALKRVGAYIRVSSDSEDQENSFITQYDEPDIRKPRMELDGYIQGQRNNRH